MPPGVNELAGLDISPVGIGPDTLGQGHDVIKSPQCQPGGLALDQTFQPEGFFSIGPSFQC